MPSLNPFRRQQPDRPTLRQRAADLKAGLSRLSPGAEPNQAPALPTTAPTVDAADVSTLARIARHRLARNRWTDAVMPADRAWRLRHDLNVSAEAVAAAEAERDAADALVTSTWNGLFEAPPASSAELLALLRHAQHHVDEDHAPDAAIELSGMVRAIGDAVEVLRDMPASGSGPDVGASPDRFLIDLGPTLLPLLNEADAEWAKVSTGWRRCIDRGRQHRDPPRFRRLLADRVVSSIRSTLHPPRRTTCGRSTTLQTRLAPSPTRWCGRGGATPVAGTKPRVLRVSTTPLAS